jgi:L-methionine (R)-S-oxide reductase
MNKLETYIKNLTAQKKIEINDDDFTVQIKCLLNSKLPHDQTILLDEFVANIAFENADRFNWTGIYLINSQNLLEVVSFRGEKTPHLIIPIDSGICGAAVRESKTLNIADVAADPRYLSCSIKTKSEIVVPIFNREKKVIGEIDIDSHIKNAFTKDDEKMLSEKADFLGNLLS